MITSAARLAVAENTQPIEDAPLVMYDGERLSLDGQALSLEEPELTTLSRRIVLAQQLRPHLDPGRVLLLVDRETPMGVVHRIGRALVRAGYTKFEFIVSTAAVNRTAVQKSTD